MANRFWVGGGSSANWNATGNTNWSTTSGGSNNASVPGTNDIALFDANSGTGNSIISANITVQYLDCTGYTGTLTHNSGVTLGLSSENSGTPYTLRNVLIFSAAMTYSHSADSIIDPLVNNGVICHNTITPNGKTLGTLRPASTSKMLVLTSDVVLTGTFELLGRYLNQNGYKITAANVISDGSGFRAWGSSLTGGIYFSSASSSIFGGTAGSGENDQAQAQSFIAASNQIRAVIIPLTKIGTPTDDITVSIASTVGGSAIASTSLSLDSLTSGIQLFEFSTPVSVTPTDTYFIRIERSGARDTSNYVNWPYTNENAYPDGAYSSRSNTTWTEDTGRDYQFIVINGGVESDIEVTGIGAVFSVSNNTSFQFFNDMNVSVTNNSASAKTFVGGNYRYLELYNATDDTGTLTITGNNHFDTLKIDSGRTTLFSEGSTQIIEDLEADGATLQSTSIGTNFTFSKASGTVDLVEGALRDSTATGGATFRALMSEDQGGNIGWTFLSLPIVFTVNVSSITGVSADLIGDITEITDDVTRRGFVLSVSSHINPFNTDPDDSDYEIVVDESGTYGVGTFSLNASGLDNDTVYYVRSFAESIIGFSYGNEISFKTNTIPLVGIANPTNRQSESVTLNGEVIDTGGDIVTEVGFVWDVQTHSMPNNVDPSASGYTNSQGTTGTFGLGEFNEDVTNLSPNTMYFVRAYAENAQGWSYGDELTFSTIKFPNTTSIVNLQTTPTAIINESTNPTNVTNISL
jgi:hypothetical protein